MDTRNVIAAISLSAAVIILYSLFFQPDPSSIRQNSTEQKKLKVIQIHLAWIRMKIFQNFQEKML